jgi:hypothetical protein
MGLISIRFVPSEQRVIVTGSGDLAVSDMMDAASRIYSDAQFERGMTMMADFSAARLMLSADNVWTVAGFVSRNLERRGKGRCAVITGRDVDYGVVRMAQAYLEDAAVELGVFRNIGDAEGWLEHQGVAEAQRFS